ncbi:sugar phosphate nucleotidyltransferase [Haloarchaeobius baliensis]|uniref:sugar phosphate nucleotidyltransferase n=1 Tax=Haloarchaeobius baliensis TaxID=1670458 RepID=UPI003F8852D3
MQGVVPAAGEGTRLRPLTADRPKALVEVAGEPILTHCFRTLLAAGVTELVVVVGYEGEQILAHYGDVFEGVPVTYVRQDEQLGLGHAVLQAEAHVDGDFIVLNGDNVFVDGIGELVAAGSPHDGAVLVEPVSRGEAKTTGVVETTADGLLTALVEKADDPPSTLALGGCMLLPEAVFDALASIPPSDRGEYELTDAVDRLVDDGCDILTVPFDGDRVNVNSQADIERAERLLSG